MRAKRNVPTTTPSGPQHKVRAFYAQRSSPVVAFVAVGILGSFADPVQAADAKGFAWFWAFLGTVAVVLGASALWILRTQKDGEDA